MPTKRQRVIRNAGEIFTPDALAAYEAGDSSALALALRLPPWEFSPLDVYEGAVPAWLKDRPWRQECWAKALEMRRELEAAFEGSQGKRR